MDWAGRLWLDRLAFVVPGTTATRWLLIADLACLVALGLAARRPRLALPLVVGAGFLALNVLGMATLDFYLGLALFHPAVALTTLVVLRRARWLGAVTLVLSLALGVVT
jgi:hypothetical protein